MRKFFEKVENIEDLKKQYKKLAMKLHPDRGGNEEEFKAMANEYTELFEKLQSGEKVKQSAAAYANIINKIIDMDISIEICGTWVWLSGNTYEVKSTLKEIGFKWASKKKMWYWHEGERSKSRGKTTMNDIRNTYGSEMVKGYRKTFKAALAG